MTKEDNIKKSTYELKILEKHNMRFSEVESEVRIRCRKDMCWDFNVYSLSKFLCRINCRPQHQYPKPQYPQQQYPQLQYPQHQYPQPQYPQHQYPQPQYPQHRYPQPQYPQQQYPQHQYPQPQ